MYYVKKVTIYVHFHFGGRWDCDQWGCQLVYVVCINREECNQMLYHQRWKWVSANVTLVGPISCVSLVMDIRISPHRDIVAFKELLTSWITDAGEGCSYRFVQVSYILGYSKWECNFPSQAFHYQMRCIWNPLRWKCSNRVTAWSGLKFWSWLALGWDFQRTRYLPIQQSSIDSYSNLDWKPITKLYT